MPSFITKLKYHLVDGAGVKINLLPSSDKDDDNDKEKEKEKEKEKDKNSNIKSPQQDLETEIHPQFGTFDICLNLPANINLGEAKLVVVPVVPTGKSDKESIPKELSNLIINPEMFQYTHTFSIQEVI